MSKEQKHTPGPWEWVSGYNHSTGNVDCVGSIRQVNHKEGGYICSIDDIGEHESEAEANAHLIAKAPETLKALEDLVEVADEKTGHSEDYGHLMSDEPEASRKLSTAFFFSE